MSCRSAVAIVAMSGARLGTVQEKSWKNTSGVKKSGSRREWWRHRHEVLGQSDVESLVAFEW